MPVIAPNPDRLPMIPPAQCPAGIYLLADDLTGACDAAAAFLPAGYSARIWLESKALAAAQETLQALNTASRSLPADRAAAVVTEAVTSLAPREETLVFKKVDSAARGPFAAELMAAHKALGTRAILLAPAFPLMGRTVRDGILRIEDAAGQHTQLSLAGLFPEEMQSAIVRITAPGELQSALQSGKKVLLCDSQTQEDLEALACTAQELRGLLYAGSAGLARALASLQDSIATPPLPVAARTLVIAGTPHPVTRLQLEQLGKNGFEEAYPAVRVLRIRCENDDEERIRAAYDAYDPQALILTGGETALLVLQALGAHSLILQGEFAPGIPWGTVQGGRADGRTVITKSGGFGTRTALSDILTTLSGAA